MADIKLSYITPRYFFETVKLLKENDYKFYISYDSVEIRFLNFSNEYDIKNVNQNWDKLEMFISFLNELKNSPIPIDLDEFVKTYTQVSEKRIYRKNKNI